MKNQLKTSKYFKYLVIYSIGLSLSWIFLKYSSTSLYNIYNYKCVISGCESSFQFWTLLKLPTILLVILLLLFIYYQYEEEEISAIVHKNTIYKNNNGDGIINATYEDFDYTFLIIVCPPFYNLGCVCCCCRPHYDNVNVEMFGLPIIPKKTKKKNHF